MRTLKETSAAIHEVVCLHRADVAVLAAAGSLDAMARAEKHEVRHQIEQLEDAWRNAVLHGNIRRWMGCWLTTIWQSRLPASCNRRSRRSPSLRSGPIRSNSLDSSDRKIRIYGTTALVTSRAEVKGNGPEGSMSGSYRYTRVYVRGCARDMAHCEFRGQPDPGAGERRASKPE